MAKSIDLLMNLKDGVSPKLGTINDNLKSCSGKAKALGKSFTSLGGILKGAFVTGTIATFMAETMKAYDTQILATKSLERSLKATGNSSKQVMEDLKEWQDFASQQQNITAFGDEDTLQRISDLIGQGFGKKQIKDIVAMSQDIARGTGDTQENVIKTMSAYVKTGQGAKRLSKTYQLNANLLGKGTTEAERMAEVWQAFNEAGYKGSSADYLNTFSGKLEVIKGRLGDLNEPIGALFETLLGFDQNGNFADQLDLRIQDLTNDIQYTTQRAEELGGGIGGVGQACFEQHPYVSTFFAIFTGSKILGALSTIGGALGSFGEVLTDVGTTIGAFFSGSVIATAVAWSVGVIGAISAVTVWLGKLSDYYKQTKADQDKLNQSQMESVGAYNPSAVKGSPVINIKDGINADKNATGTSYFRGGLTSINEHGGELITLPSGSQVIPADKTDKLLSGGMTFNVPITIQGNVIGNEDYANQLGDMIVNRLQTAMSNC